MTFSTTFPDPAELAQLLHHHEQKVARYQQGHPIVRLLMHTSATMNWIGDFITDPSVQWTRTCLTVDELTLTGTSPTWNEVILRRCERSPAKLREAIKSDPEVTVLFQGVVFTDVPILVRCDGDKKKVLDGMHRVIAAVRDGRDVVDAFVAQIRDRPRPSIEEHVVYDLLRAYYRGLNRDRAGLIAGVRFLRRAYANVDPILRDHFWQAWTGNEEMRSIISEILQD